MGTTTQPVEGEVELVLPADARVVRMGRLVATGMAVAAGFDIEDVEDLRLAVDEGCVALVDGGDGSPLLLRFTLVGNGIAVQGNTAAGPNAITFEPDHIFLSHQVLAITADEHELRHRDGQVSFRVSKRGWRHHV